MDLQLGGHSGDSIPAWPDFRNPTGLAPDTARLRRLPARAEVRSVPNGINGEVREKIMKAWGNDTVRGGQTVFHGLRMWSQLVTVGVMTIAVLVVTVPVFMLWRTTPTYDGYAAGMLTLAETKLSIGYDADAGQEVRLENGDTVVATIADIAAFGPWHAARDGILETVISGAWLGGKIGAGLVALMLGWFRYQGYRLKQKKRLRGAELVSARELSRRVHPLKVRALHRLAGAPAPYRIAGVPYPERTETQHTIVSGTTGSGKTVLISDLVQQIRQRGDRCVIYDKMGSYTQSFFDPERDVLLNPLDARAPRWSPFFEARSPRDFDTMAAALIPQQRDTVDPVLGHGRAAIVLQRRRRAVGKGRAEQPGAGRAPAQDEPPGARRSHGRDRCAIHRGPGKPENRAERARHAHRAPRGDGDSAGCRETVLDPGVDIQKRGKQFSVPDLPGRPAREPPRGLISTWLEIAVNALLSLDRDDDRRIWVILDELPTLHQVPSLQPGLAESRQFGGCFVLGVQVASALRDLYGRNGAETISGLCGTRVVFAAPDRDTAQWSADSLGRSEIEEVAEGVSYGADPYRDGVTLTPRRELQSLALPSEITRLPNLTGYLKLPGPYPVARIELDYVKRSKIAPRFVPRTQAHGPVPDTSVPESPEPNGDAQDVSAPVSPDPKPDEHDEPVPVMAGTNGVADSAVAPECAGRIRVRWRQDRERCRRWRACRVRWWQVRRSGDGRDRSAARPTGGTPRLRLRTRRKPHPESEETETAQSKGRPQLGWTNI